MTALESWLTHQYRGFSAGPPLEVEAGTDILIGVLDHSLCLLGFSESLIVRSGPA
jgi:hypothetical protein